MRWRRFIVPLPLALSPWQCRHTAASTAAAGVCACVCARAHAYCVQKIQCRVCVRGAWKCGGKGHTDT